MRAVAEAPPPPLVVRPRLPGSEDAVTGAVYAVQLRAAPAGETGAEPPGVALVEGEHLYQTKVEIAGRRWERLRVGYFPSLAAARRARERLAPQFPDAWVVEVPPDERAAARQIVRDASPSPAPRPVDARPARPPPASSFAIQLRAIPAGEEAPPLPAFPLPPGTGLYWTSVEMNGRQWRRLRVGPFPRRDAASRALSQLAPLFPDAWITGVQAEESERAIASHPLD